MSSRTDPSSTASSPVSVAQWASPIRGGDPRSGVERRGGHSASQFEWRGPRSVGVRREDRALLGAHMIGAEVTEHIQGFMIAITLKATEAQLLHTILPHPTLSETMGESTLAAFGRVIHGVGDRPDVRASHFGREGADNPAGLLARPRDYPAV